MKLLTPRIRVTVENRDGTASEYTVQTDNRDLVRWDLTRSRKQWPDPGAAAFLWLTFLAWAALTRSGETEDKFEDFAERCINVRTVDADDNDLEPGEVDGLTADPTRTGAAPVFS